MKKFAYVRVSNDDQNTARQLEGPPPVDRTYQEKVSGKNADRPQLQALLGTLRTGDEVYVYEMSRLGRSMIDLVALTDQIVDAGCSVTFIKEGHDVQRHQQGRSLSEPSAEHDERLCRVRARHHLAEVERGHRHRQAERRL